MPARKLTEKELSAKRIDSKTAKFMASVRQYVASKNGGAVPEAFEGSFLLLEEYYKQFIMLSEEISKLPELVVDSRYGKVPSPLLSARDKAAARLESMMKQMGITFKSANSMAIIEPVKEESPLEAFVKGKIEKR